MSSYQPLPFDQVCLVASLNKLQLILNVPTSLMYDCKHLYLDEHDDSSSFVVGDQLAGDLRELGAAFCAKDHAPECDADTALGSHPMHDLRPILTVCTLRVDKRYVGPVVVD